MSRVRDRCVGVLLGLAAGDRNGGPAKMALVLARSLIQHRAFDPSDVLLSYVEWWRRDGIDSGPTAGTVLQRIAMGVAAELAVQSVDRERGGLTGGCNPAHRATPLAMAAFLPGEGLAAAAIREAALTHQHPAARETSAAVVVLCRSLVMGMSWDAARGAASNGRVTEIAEALLHPGAVAIGNGGYAPEALKAALHFVESAANVNDALERAVLFAGPANYCPVLVGAIGGARWGASSIDPRLLRNAAPSVQPTDIRAVAEVLANDWDHAD